MAVHEMPSIIVEHLAPVQVSCSASPMTMPRAPQEAEPEAVLVLGDLADQLGVVAAQAGDDVVDVLDGEHDAAHASGFAGALSGSAPRSSAGSCRSAPRRAAEIRPNSKPRCSSDTPV